MAIELMNPPGLVEPTGYTHVSVATGTRTVYLAGQVSQDANGDVVGEGDLAAQAEQALRNVGTALAAAGASFADVAKATIYVVDWSPEKMEPLFTGFGRAAAELGITTQVPTTMIGVAALADPRLLVEFDMTAVLD